MDPDQISERHGDIASRCRRRRTADGQAFTCAYDNTAADLRQEQAIKAAILSCVTWSLAELAGGCSCAM